MHWNNECSVWTGFKPEKKEWDSPFQNVMNPGTHHVKFLVRTLTYIPCAAGLRTWQFTGEFTNLISDVIFSVKVTSHGGSIYFSTGPTYFMGFNLSHQNNEMTLSNTRTKILQFLHQECLHVSLISFDIHVQASSQEPFAHY